MNKIISIIYLCINAAIIWFVFESGILHIGGKVTMIIAAISAMSTALLIYKRSKWYYPIMVLNGLVNLLLWMVKSNNHHYTGLTIIVGVVVISTLIYALYEIIDRNVLNNRG